MLLEISVIVAVLVAISIITALVIRARKAAAAAKDAASGQANARPPDTVVNKPQIPLQDAAPTNSIITTSAPVTTAPENTPVAQETTLETNPPTFAEYVPDRPKFAEYVPDPPKPKPPPPKPKPKPPPPKPVKPKAPKPVKTEKPAITAKALQNPLIADHADPGTFYHEGWFYTAATPTFTMLKSKDLRTWQNLGPALKNDSRTGPKDFWAPNFCRLPDGSWLMVYTADRKLYLAKSASPQGQYTYHAGPLLGGRWAIDGMAFVDPKSKKTYLYWNQSSKIFCGELNNTTITKDVEILSSKSQPEAWVTESVNEAPFVFFRNDTYYCVYSGNATGPKYGIGYATASSPTGPWRKNPANPVIWGFGTNKTRGTGHCTVVAVPDGPWLMFYHASPGGTRDLFVDVIEWNGGNLTVPGAPSRQLPNPMEAKKNTQDNNMNPINTTPAKPEDVVQPVKRGALKRSIVINGNTYTGNDLAALFGGRDKDKGWVDALVKSPALLIDCWQVVLDTPDQYTWSTGIKGKFWNLKSNSDMEDFGGKFQDYAGGKLPESWRGYVKDNFGRLLNENGLPGSSDGQFQWGPAYTFHIARKKIFAIGEDAVKRIWTGGAGPGARWMRYWLVDEHWFTKPLKRGDTTVTLPVDSGWASKLNPEVARRLRDNGTKAEFPVGFAMGWNGSRNEEGRGTTPSYHGLWDLLCVLNNVYDGAKGSAFDLIPDPTMRKRIGSAFELMAANVKSGADDFSGYSDSGKKEWRKACAQELSRKGVKHVLDTFGRL
jgi:xylan 1,4-beta-xylosidase